VSVVDWESKPEPWRSIGLEFVDFLEGRAPQPTLDFFDRAEAARRARGLSIVDIERALGWPQSYYCSARGKRALGRERRDQLAALLEIDP